MLCSVSRTDGSRGLAEELIPPKPRSHVVAEGLIPPTTCQNQVLDKTKVLHGPQTQTYGETNYLSKSSFEQNQGIAWSSDSNLWGNQLLKNQVLDRTKVLHGPRTQTYGETNYLSKSSFGQNQGIAWFSDSNLWENQLLIKIKFLTELRYCVALEFKPMKRSAT